MVAIIHFLVEVPDFISNYISSSSTIGIKLSSCYIWAHEPPKTYRLRAKYNQWTDQYPESGSKLSENSSGSYEIVNY